MGRFDALTNLEGKQQEVNPPADSPTLSAQTEKSNKEPTKDPGSRGSGWVRGFFTQAGFTPMS
jgi:hypothetical protein